jgi:hypothetical protein
MIGKNIHQLQKLIAFLLKLVCLTLKAKSSVPHLSFGHVDFTSSNKDYKSSLNSILE